MYDLIILGGGPGGYEAAALAGKRGLDVALIEENRLGGICLNEGCIPLKSYLHTSGLLEKLDKAGKDGRISFHAVLHQEAVYQKKEAVAGALRQSIAGLLKHAGVRIINSRGVIEKAEEGAIRVRASGQTVEGKRLVIATGSKERRLPSGLGEPGIQVIYSSGLLKLQELPETIAIIGAGVIGIESASYLCDAGCRVTMVDAAGSIGKGLDGEIAKALQKILEQKGIRVRLHSKVISLEADGIIAADGNGEEKIRADMALVSIGRKPGTAGYGLENTDIRYNDYGISVDEGCETNIRGVYACGDVTGGFMQAHVAYRQAQIIVENICGGSKRMDYRAVPRIIYSNPEVLTVGMTEENLKGAGVPYTSRTIPMTYSGKYFAEYGKDGAIAKMLIDSAGKIVGFSMIGNGASEIGLAAELMIRSGMTVEEADELIYPHPTVGEIVHGLARRV